MCPRNIKGSQVLGQSMCGERTCQSALRLLSCGQPKSSNEAVKEALERMKMALADTQTNL